MRTILISAIITIALAVPAAGDALGRELLELTNASRTERGLPALVHDERLARIATRHTARMRRAGRIFHNDDLASELHIVRWTTAGENVGVGPTIERIHEELMASEIHRRNILGDFDRVGVAAAGTAERIYVVQVFAAGHGPSVLSGGRVRPTPMVQAEDGTSVPCWYYGPDACPH